MEREGDRPVRGRGRGRGRGGVNEVNVQGFAAGRGRGRGGENDGNNYRPVRGRGRGRGNEDNAQNFAAGRGRGRGGVDEPANNQNQPISRNRNDRFDKQSKNQFTEFVSNPTPRNQSDNYIQKVIDQFELQIINDINNSENGHKQILVLLEKCSYVDKIYQFFALLEKIFKIKEDCYREDMINKILDDAIGKTDSVDFDISKIIFSNLKISLVNIKDLKISKTDELYFSKFIKYAKNNEMINEDLEFIYELFFSKSHRNNLNSNQKQSKPIFNKFDNDKMSIEQIQLLPTYDEIIYRSHGTKDIQLPLQNKSNAIDTLNEQELIVDRNFRLLREELIHDMEENQQKKKFILEELNFVRLENNKHDHRLVYIFEFKRPKGNTNDPRFWSKRFNNDSLVFIEYGLKNIKEMEQMVSSILILSTVSYRDENQLIDKKILTLEIGLTPVSTEYCLQLNKLISLGLYSNLRQVSDSYFSIEPILRRLKQMNSIPFQEDIWTLINNNNANNISNYESDDESIHKQKKFNQMKNKENLDILKNTKFEIIDIFPNEIKIPKQMQNWKKFTITDNESQFDVIQKFKTYTTLDPGQIDSIISFLKDPLVLVHGPPGTGKTFIGALMVEIIYNNTNLKILTVTFTNHALDQFLNDLIERNIEDLVRLGSRSKDPNMDKQKVVPDYQSNSKQEKFNFAINRDKIEEIYINYRKNFDNILDKNQKNYIDELKNQNRNLQNYYKAKLRHISENKTFYDQPKNERDLTDFNLRFIMKTYFGIDDDENDDFENQYISEELEEFQNLSDVIKKLRQRANFNSIDSKRIIAATTVGCAKNNQLIKDALPDILIIEEAGEVLEPHLITSLFPSIKQVILIGDHKQLRPKLSCQKLTEEANRGYDFNLSILEQCINGNSEYSTLTVQHRMHPEISKYVNELFQDNYVIDSDKLSDLNHRPKVKGVKNRVQFIDHDVFEDKTEDNDSTKTNKQSAEFAVKLAEQFINQNQKSDEITILTPQLGQLFKIMNIKSTVIASRLGDRDEIDVTELEDIEIDKDQVEKKTTSNSMKFVRSATVDNQQGEECAIIILDLVRCNKDGIIGFLKEFQRMNVALSRAKIGMFIIGSRSTLTKNQDIQGNWTKFFEMLEENNSISRMFRTQCEKHDNYTDVNNLEDFEKIKNGGCIEICYSRKKCGHICKIQCHNNPCEEQKCQEPCQKLAKNCTAAIKHKCQDMCQETCSDCKVPTLVKLLCGHELKMQCFRNTPEIIKKSKCSKIIDQICSKCKSVSKIKCHDKNNFKCTSNCKYQLECGHTCNLPCHDSSIPHQCVQPCHKPYKLCSHSCSSECSHEGACPPCNKICTNKCTHSQCTHLCSDICNLCSMPCDFQCPHQGKKCSKICSAECDIECNRRCTKLLVCGHQCPSKCGEICPSSKQCIECCKKNRDVNENIIEMVVDFITFETQSDLNLDENPIFVLECGHIISQEQLNEKVKSINSDVDKFIKGDVHEIPKIECELCKSKIYNIRSLNKLNNIQFLVNSYKKFCSTLDNLQAEIDNVKKISDFYIKYSSAKMETKTNHSNSIKKNKFSLFFLDLIDKWEPQYQQDLQYLQDYKNQIQSYKFKQQDQYLDKWFEDIKQKINFETEKIEKQVYNLVRAIEKYSDIFLKQNQINQYFKLQNQLFQISKQFPKSVQIFDKDNQKSDTFPIKLKLLIYQNSILKQKNTIKDIKFIKDEKQTLLLLNQTIDSFSKNYYKAALALTGSVLNFPHDYLKSFLIKDLEFSDQFIISDNDITNDQRLFIDKINYAEKEIQKIKKHVEEDSIEEAIKAFNRIQGWDENTGSGHQIRCRCGMIQVVGECGMAMQEGRCPNCREMIGGRDHEFVPGQEQVEGNIADAIRGVRN